MWQAASRGVLVDELTGPGGDAEGTAAGSVRR